MKESNLKAPLGRKVQEVFRKVYYMNNSYSDFLCLVFGNEVTREKFLHDHSV